MEETLYNIEIHKDEEGKFLGKIFSEVDGVKEFKSNRLEDLLRDITFDIQLALDEFSKRSTLFADEYQEEEIR